MGDYPPNSPLPTEARLAQDYGVSRTVVRSALDLLKREGVVQSRQGSGTIVASFDSKAIARLNRDAQRPELIDCFACRLAIEPEIAATAAANLSHNAGVFLKDERDLLESGDEGNEYERSARDAQFHIRLAEFSGNTFFVSIMTTMRPYMLFAMNIIKNLNSGAQHRHFNLSRQEHLAIITAILDQDVDKARAAMRRHIVNGRSRIFQDTAGELDPR